MSYKDTKVARNCNVFNDHQALSRIIDARRGTGRLPDLLHWFGQGLLTRPSSSTDVKFRGYHT